MKILSAICLAVLLLLISPFLIIFFGAAELYKLYEEVLKNVYKHLDEDQEERDMLKEKVDTEFCGLSDEEKKLIEEKEEDISLDFSIKYYGYENIYEIFNDYGLIAILEVLREHLPFIKEQEIKIMNKYEEQRSHTTDYVIRDFLDCLNDIFFSLQIDVENINSKFFERIKILPKENYKSLVNDVFGMFIDMLCEKDVEEKVEIMKLISQKG